MIRLLGKISSINVRKVAWTCAELGLPFEREDWGKGFASTQTPDFLALNPNAQVPVIIEGDRVLWESNTICRYLAAREGREDLLPAEPWARAQVERWMDWQATDLNMSWRYVFPALARGEPPNPDPVQIAEAAAKWNATMAILEDHLAAGGGYAVGGAFTLADIGLGLSANRWLRTPIEHPDLPAVLAYVERLRSRAGALFDVT
ncbi:glutathione S-transferase [Caulobacter ginsengisoli]|uniref:Glutathione S-transferase n=1 Tax=Caulobacter ginsengisoli TaxID=400775 RepID=A0ABU0IX82_9CAUL|nr:glutathione S-transferase N-terminal domain-containing protein [Caulobacter ginsengisoli]MDQ0466614.1 glutathione S-transferase [Caulobacter ginsengisoli]